MLENDTHDNSSIDQLYDCIVSDLTEGENQNQFVPRRDKQFYKFWWNEELTLLKGIACDADNYVQLFLIFYVFYFCPCLSQSLHLIGRFVYISVCSLSVLCVVLL